MMKSINTIGSSKLSDKDRELLDFYQTPTFATESLVNSKLIGDGCIWEPMAGNGAISKVLARHNFKVISSDVIERDYKLDFVCDFFNNDIDVNATQIVTNPPYKYADDFIVKCLSANKPDFLGVFLPIRYLEGKKRYMQIYSKYKPSDVIVFAKRLGCYKDSDVKNGVVITEYGIGSAVAYMWLCFTKNKTTGLYDNIDTKMHWIY